MTRSCPGCRAKVSRPVGTCDGFRIESCRGCRTLFTAELPAISEATDYASYYHEGNLEIPGFVHERLGELVESFAAHRRRNRWLDVGFGAGALMEAASARGWEVVGTEVSSRAVEAMDGRGFDVRLGELADADLPPGAFDVVSLVEVVEHVPDPDSILEATRPLLRPGGVVYITTPHSRGASARLLGTRWSVVAPPEHLQIFSLRGLRTALGRAGLEPRSVHTHAVNPQELIHALRGPARSTTGGHRVEASYRLNESLSARRSGALAKRAVNAVLDVSRLGDSIKLVAGRPD
jgi:SAM-dependent methyltransferase